MRMLFEQNKEKKAKPLKYDCSGKFEIRTRTGPMYQRRQLLAEERCQPFLGRPLSHSKVG